MNFWVSGYLEGFGSVCSLLLLLLSAELQADKFTDTAVPAITAADSADKNRCEHSSNSHTDSFLEHGNLLFLKLFWRSTVAIIIPR